MSYVEAEFTILIHDLLSFFLSSIAVHSNGCARRQQTPGLLMNSAGEKHVENYLLLRFSFCGIIKQYCICLSL